MLQYSQSRCHEEDEQDMPLVYSVEYDEEIIGLPRAVSEESVSYLKPYYAHPTKPKVNMDRSYSFMRKNLKFEESFKTVGYLVSDDEEEVKLPVVYTVAWDEELSVPKPKEEVKNEVKESQRVVMKPKALPEAKPEVKVDITKYVPKIYVVKEEWFKSVGSLVSDESEQEPMPIVYTVKYDEELVRVRERT